MTSVAVLGAGAGGLSCAVELSLSGHDVRLWHRGEATLRPYLGGEVAFDGVMGTGTAKGIVAGVDLYASLHGVDVAVVCLPAFLHPALFADLAAVGASVPVMLSPGGTGGALHLREVFRRHRRRLPPVAELSSLPYVARALPGGGVNVTGRAAHLRCGLLPGGEEAVKAAEDLFSCELSVSDVLASSLANVNMVLHPPGAVLAAAWVEATAGDFTFYVDALTPAVARVIDALDDERLAVAGAFGHALPSLVDEMALIGTAQPPGAGTPGARTVHGIRSGEANRSIRAPGALGHRYYKEDFAFGLQPLLALADIAGCAAPTARSLLDLGRTMVGPDMPAGLGALEMGIAGLSRTELLGGLTI